MMHASTYRRFLASSSLLLLAGCASESLTQLREMNPQATDFPSALALEYLDYAESEKEMDHPMHGSYFAQKGLKSLQGELPEPERVPDGLPDIVAEQLAASRLQLLTLLTDDMKRVAPQEAARVQLVFDCWVHQQANHAAKEGIPCAREFESALAELETVAESFAYTQEMEKILKFSGKETALSPFHLQVLDDIAVEVANQLKYEVEIVSQPSGRGDNRRAIAMKRAEAVRLALTARGVPESYIEMDSGITSKTVYLSNDEENQPANSVKITVKAVGEPPSQEEEEE